MASVMIRAEKPIATSAASPTLRMRVRGAMVPRFHPPPLEASSYRDCRRVNRAVDAAG